MSKNLLSFAPWGAALFIVAVMLAALHAPHPTTASGMDLDGFGRLPVVSGGRTKPLDSVARNYLLVISGGKTTFTDAEGRSQPAIRWLLDVMATRVSDASRKHKVFRIENDQLLAMLKLERRPGSFRYSLEEIEPSLKQLEQQANQARKLEPNSRDLYQVKALELADHIKLFGEIMTFQEPLLIPQKQEDDWSTLPEAFAKSPQDPAIREFAELLASYAKDDAAGFNQALAAYRDTVEARRPGGTLAKTSFETSFNEWQLPYACMYLYIFVFLLTLAGWSAWVLGTLPIGAFLVRTAFSLAAFTFLVHSVALFSRMVIQDRPAPVTNLYSSAVFIGWGCALLAIVIEKLLGIGLGNILAAITGSLTLFIAYFLEQGGDTLEMMQAVLDTNFWLATHVTCVTLGYTATFVAGFLGFFYILFGQATPVMGRSLGSLLGGITGADRNEPPRSGILRVIFGTDPAPLGRLLDLPASKVLAKVLYAVICFATLLSFVGTVLGGIWADQSWGRFWGWDPKENGAVLIVIWNALILHARWGGMIKERGMAVLSVVGNMVTAWSWFGTNQLGVGLHAYGFNNTLARALVIFWFSQLLIIAVGLIPLKYWWSFRVPSVIEDESPAPNPLAAGDHPAPKDGIQARPGRRPRLA